MRLAVVRESARRPEQPGLRRYANGPAAAVAPNLLLLVLLPMHWPVAATMAAISICVLRRLEWPTGRSPVARPLGAYYFLAAVTLVHSRDLGAALRWTEAVVVVASLFAPAAAASDMERLRMCRFVVYLASVLSVYAILEAVLNLPNIWGPPSRNGQGELLAMLNEILVGSGLHRAEATLGHPLLLSFLLVVALGLAMRPELLPRRRVAVVLLLLCGILAAGSRSAAVVVILLLLWTAASRRRAPSVVAAMGLLVALAIGAFAAFRQTAAMQSFLADSSLTHRLGGIEAALHLAQEQAWQQTLLGNGYGLVLLLFRQGRLQNDGFFAVDNQFVYTFAELGLAGLVVLLWLLWRAFVSTDGLTVLAVVAGVVMFLSFDVFPNASSLGLLAVVLGVTRRRSCRVRPQKSLRPNEGLASVPMVGQADADPARMEIGSGVDDHGRPAEVQTEGDSSR